MDRDQLERIRGLVGRHPGMPVGHLAELIASDPVLRLAPYHAMIQDAIDQQALEMSEGPDGRTVKAVAQAQANPQ